MGCCFNFHNQDHIFDAFTDYKFYFTFLEATQLVLTLYKGVGATDRRFYLCIPSGNQCKKRTHHFEMPNA